MCDKGMETPPSKADATISEKDLVSTTENLCVEDLMNSSVIPVLVRCLLENDHTTLQFKAACKVTNLVCGKPDIPDEAITVRLLFQLLSSFALDEHEEDILALVDFICGNHYLLYYIVNSRCADPIVALIKVDRPTSWLYIVIRLINNLFCYQFFVETEMITNYMTLLDSYSEVVLKFIPLLGHPDAKIQKEALTAIINIAECSSHTSAPVMDRNVLEFFPALLLHPNKEIYTVAFQFLLKFPSLSQSTQQEIIDSNLLPNIFEILSKGESKTQNLAAQVISVFVKSDDPLVVSALITKGGISCLCDLLACNDMELVKSALLSLKAILKSEGVSVQLILDMIRECDGLDKIKNLQNHEDSIILKEANKIHLLFNPINN